MKSSLSQARLRVARDWARGGRGLENRALWEEGLCRGAGVDVEAGLPELLKEAGFARADRDTVRDRLAVIEAAPLAAAVAGAAAGSVAVAGAAVAVVVATVVAVVVELVQ